MSSPEDSGVPAQTGNGSGADPWRRRPSPRASLVSGLRSLVKPPESPDEACDLCNLPIPSKHRHLLHLEERRIVCVCGTCWALRSGDPEYRPTGNRTVWLDNFDLPEDLWASFQVPIGLCFFFYSGSVNKIVGLYPSPAGATECELYLEAWEELKKLNPILENLETDIEALMINRLSDPPQFAIAPTDRAYELVGIVKAKWEGISGGAGLKEGVELYFAELQVEAKRW